MARPTKEEQERKRLKEDERLAGMIAAALTAAQDKMRADLRTELLAEVTQIAAIPTAPVVNLVQPHSAEGDKGFASALALAIANLSSQGTNKAPYVPPEVVDGWKSAQQRMVELIVSARAEGSTDLSRMPRYRVTKPQYLNETKIEPQWHDKSNNRMADTEIYWDEVPNQGMEPINETALAIYAEFRLSIGEAEVVRKDSPTPWVRTDKRLFKGMSPEQREKNFGASTHDPRVSGAGAPTTGKHIHLLGTVSQPAVVR